MKSTRRYTSSDNASCLVILILALIIVVLGIVSDMLITFAVHWVFPQMEYWKEFILVTLALMALSMLGNNGRSK